MIRYFVGKTVCKRTAKPATHSLLSFVCFLMAVLGSSLIPTNSLAFRKGDEVVAQNKGPGGKVLVRPDPFKPKPPEDDNLVNEVPEVPNGTRGTVQSGPKQGDDYLWYEIKWEQLPVGKNLPIVGWSAETVDGCKVIGPAAVADKRDAIVNALFKGLPHEKTNHDYNGYGCFPSDQSGYKDGHSGWDVQTTTVAGIATADEPFYSLTAGKVIIATQDTLNKTAVIAIYNEVCEKTTLYLHAREIDKDIMEMIDQPNNYIDEGTYLGIQGNTGLWPPENEDEEEKYDDNRDSYAEHVHIEVIKGVLRKNRKIPAEGADGSIDPIPYLYRWVNKDLTTQFLPWDVNHDGDVDIFDWLQVVLSILRNPKMIYHPRYDVNSDGIVNKIDLGDISEHFGESPPGSPAISRHPQVDEAPPRAGQISIGGMVISPETVQQLLDIARKEDNGSIHFKRGIAMLESLLAAMIPETTVLFANYPNPFNPETWIPYHLASDTDVTVTIHDATGVLVRRLAVGYQEAGYYTSRKRAVYWDGRNETGERIASAVYFYTLTTGDSTTTRKMVILK